MDSSSTGTRPANIVFLSGEAQPLTIPGTDRRYWIVDADKAMTLDVPSDQDGAAIFARWQNWLNSTSPWESQTAEPAPHPSHNAPKCEDCRHISERMMFGSESYCLHPAQPVSLVNGNSVADCRRARDDAKAKLHGLLCGSAGALFEPVDSGA